jgi:hypothetical protein
MPFVSKVPVGCIGLDFARVSRVLARRRGHFPSAARELGVTASDLRRLAWAHPGLLAGAHAGMRDAVWEARGVVYRALFDDGASDEVREWASEQVLSSYGARDSPLAPARGRWGPSRPVVLPAEWELVVAKEDNREKSFVDRDGWRISVSR